MTADFFDGERFNLPVNSGESNNSFFPLVNSFPILENTLLSLDGLLVPFTGVLTSVMAFLTSLRFVKSVVLEVDILIGLSY